MRLVCDPGPDTYLPAPSPGTHSLTPSTLTLPPSLFGTHPFIFGTPSLTVWYSLTADTPSPSDTSSLNPWHSLTLCHLLPHLLAHIQSLSIFSPQSISSLSLLNLIIFLSPPLYLSFPLINSSRCFSHFPFPTPLTHSPTSLPSPRHLFTSLHSLPSSMILCASIYQSNVSKQFERGFSMILDLSFCISQRGH